MQLGEWRLFEVLEWTAAVLNRVDRDAFFAKFKDAEAVQYFYEPFLEAFDPELRKQLGVWYTPPEIVRYMVARVDTVLREELDRPDGLADPDVYVLDPCCGTGAYLAEVLRVIAATLKDRGEEALLGGKLKAAAMERIFGFEILPAPFVVAHLQLGLFLQSAGVPLAEAKHERAAVYLTNALNGWEPPEGPKQRLLFAEMEEERDKAEAVKKNAPLLVVLGNPPYNGFAGVAMKEERDLSDAYRTTQHAPKPQGQGLNDLYVRFFRMAERCIVERHLRHGVVCFISNYSWLDGAEDLVRVKDGTLAPDKVRRLRIAGAVDTGSTFLMLPAQAAKQLGVPSAGKVGVRYADRRRGSKSVVENVRVDLLGRHGNFKAILETNRTDVLIGAIVLEDLDLLVD